MLKNIVLCLTLFSSLTALADDRNLITADELIGLWTKISIDAQTQVTEFNSDPNRDGKLVNGNNLSPEAIRETANWLAKNLQRQVEICNEIKQKSDKLKSVDCVVGVENVNGLGFLAENHTRSEMLKDKKQAQGYLEFLNSQEGQAEVDYANETINAGVTESSDGDGISEEELSMAVGTLALVQQTKELINATLAQAK